MPRCGRRRVLHAARLHQHWQRLGDGDPARRRSRSASTSRRTESRIPRSPAPSRRRRPVAIPAAATGSGSAMLEGRPNVYLDVDRDGDVEIAAVPVVSDGKTFAITDPTPVPYRKVVDIQQCNDCHKRLSIHGESRTGNAELCAACHNPNATDINRRVAGSSCQAVTGTLDDQTIDFKVMVHAIHAGAIAGTRSAGTATPATTSATSGTPAGSTTARDVTCRAPTIRRTPRTRSRRPPTPRRRRVRIARRRSGTSPPHRRRPCARPATEPGRAQSHASTARRLEHAVKAADSTTPAHAARGVPHLPRAGPECRREGGARRRRVPIQLRRI